MGRQVREISFVACLLLVVLRISIGWQFLYEGLWKLNTLHTPRPWSAEGYLKNARGPFRDFFRRMVDDPDDLQKLDYDAMVKKWDDWYARFQAHHPDLTAEQKRPIELLLNGPSEFVEPLAALPAGVDLAKFKAPKGSSLTFDAKSKRLISNFHLLPQEREQLLALAPADVTDDAQKALVEKYRAAVNKLYDRASRLSLKERLQVLLKEDPERVGLTQEAHRGTIDYQRPGDLQIYRHQLERYESKVGQVQVAFQNEHLADQWGKLQEKRASLVGPVDALTAELNQAGDKVLSTAQLLRGPVPAAPSKVGQVNTMTIWLLIGLGATLMVGLFSRISAFAAAGLLLLFYLPMPPWPGVPEAPGPEHSLIINKNLIECIACIALASLPTGRWVGLDALVRRFLFFQKTD